MTTPILLGSDEAGIILAKFKLYVGEYPSQPDIGLLGFNGVISLRQSAMAIESLVGPTAIKERLLAPEGIQITIVLLSPDAVPVTFDKVQAVSGGPGLESLRDGMSQLQYVHFHIKQPTRKPLRSVVLQAWFPECVVENTNT